MTSQDSVFAGGLSITKAESYYFPYEKSVQNFIIQQSVQNVLYLLPHPTNYKQRNCNISKKNYAVPDLKTELVQ